jgi:putative ABC transport system permease protein
MANMTRTTSFPFWLWLIALIGVLVPRRLRADWRQEWEAELSYRETLLAEWDNLNWKTKLDLLRRSLGAFRDAWLLQPQRLEDEMFQDLRFGVRVLLKKPGFALVAVFTLALGIGANTAIFSVVNAVLLKPFPYREPDGLVMIERKSDASSFNDIHSYPVYQNLREQSWSFEGVAAFRLRALTLSGADGPEMAPGARVASNFFSVLGVSPLLGRAFLPGEDQANQPNLVILSHGLWQRRFGADPNVIGQMLVAEKQPAPRAVGQAPEAETESFQIVGVMPPDFKFDRSASTKAEFWTPLSPNPRASTFWNINEWMILARLKPETSLAQARAELDVVAERIRQTAFRETKRFDEKFGLSAVTLREYLVGDTKKPLLALLGAVGCLLLIACVNVANLLLAHGVGLQKEIVIRAVLGASRRRLITQMLTESLLLSLSGGVLGWLLVRWSLQGIVWLVPKEIIFMEELSLDQRVFFFTLAASLLTGLLFGLVPALRASKPDLQATLKMGASTSGETLGGFRNLLVVAEVALALMLLAGGGLMINSFLRLTSMDTGFNPENVLSLQLNPLSRQTAPEQIAFAQEVIERVQGAPGVQAAGLIDQLPISGGGNRQSNKRRELLPEPFAGDPEEELEFEPRAVTPGYFPTMGIRLLKGRLFMEADTAAAQSVILVSERMAQQFWPGEDPVGKQLRWGSRKDDRASVIGVVSDVRHHHLSRPPTPILYAPFSQNPDSYLTLAVRFSSDPATLIPALRSQILAVDRCAVIRDVMTMEQRLGELVAQPRFYALLFGWFGAMALLLAVLGLYGVISYTVGQRTREMGIRIALGAQRRDILKLVVGHGSILTLAGILLGLGGAFALTRVLKSLLFNVGTTDPLTFASVAVLLALVSLLACWLPARRATKVNPMDALRYD